MRVPAPFTRRKVLLLGVFAWLWFALCSQLSNEWSINEQYSYGWFVPFFALYLFWLRWENRPDPSTPDPVRRNRILLPIGIPMLCLLLPVRVFELGVPDWRPVSWLHAGIVVALSFLALWASGGKPWLRHFAFPVAFIFVAVPWVLWIEARVIRRLMQFVAVIATESVNLLGIPAQLEGTLLRLSTGLVGVNEACSGVRSLQTSLMIGLLFGELRQLSLSRRIILLGGAVAVSLSANVCRAIFLVIVASRDGLKAVDQWHDFAGYSIVLVVFVASFAIAIWLSAKEQPVSSTNPSKVPRSGAFALFSSGKVAIVLVWLFAVEAGAEAWYRVHESDRLARVKWTVRWPESAAGFRELPIDERVQRTLRFDEGRAGAWQEPTGRNGGAPPAHAADLPVTWILYFFRWDSGRSSVVRARAHRPDVCLPSVGWKQVHDHGVRGYPATGVVLPFRHFEFARLANGRAPAHYAHAFYCVGEDWTEPLSEAEAADHVVAGKLSRETTAGYLRAVREGERERGQQVMQIVLMSSAPLDSEEARQRFAEFTREAIVAGEMR
jgi:exosortase